MAKQTINVGTTANDRTGDPLRTAFTKVNANFTEVYNNVEAINASVANNNVTLNDRIDNLDISDLSDTQGLIANIPTDLSDLTDSQGLIANIPADVSDLTDTQGLLVPSTTLTHLELTNSPFINSIFFEKDDYATGNSAVDTFVLEGEYGGVGITRDANNSIYNPYREVEYVEEISPDGTLWNLAGWDDLSDIQTRTYVTFHQAFDGGQLDIIVPGTKSIMHIPDYGKYYAIQWLSWTENGNGGGFSYIRYEINENEINEGIKFSDGNIQTTAFTTNPTLNVLKIDDGVHEKFQTKVDATGTVTHDCSAGHIFYHTSPDANWTANFINLNLSSTYATAITFIIVQGGIGYYPNALEIGGVSQTINWQGNATPTPSTNRVDVVTFSILNNGGTYTVLGQLTGF